MQRPEKKASVKMSVTAETFGVRSASKSDVKTLEARETDGTIVSYGTGFKMSGKYQAVDVHVGIQLPTRVTHIKQAYAEAIDIAEEQVASRIPEMRKLLNHLVKEHGRIYGDR